MPVQQVRKKQASAIGNILPNMLPFRELSSYSHIFSNPDPRAAISTGKAMAKAWIVKQNPDSRLLLAKHFLVRVIERYWLESYANYPAPKHIPRLFQSIEYRKLDNATTAVAQALGAAAAELPLEEAGYLIGTIYTALLPEDVRTAGGVFYTPPCLVDHLLGMAEQAGIDWGCHTVLDPACGGGAFLAPICLRMIEAKKHLSPDQILQHVERHLHGWELDPFSAWMTQVFVEVALKNVIAQSTAQTMSTIVEVGDSLATDLSSHVAVDLVIGNPPYGKIKQTTAIKSRFQQSLFGHPNLYGLFTHLAIELCRPSGVVAFVTPTSWLSGEYFKKLREYVRTHSTPLEANFVVSRKDVFDDALQEIMLFALRKVSNEHARIIVKEIEVLSITQFLSRPSGRFNLPFQRQAPWILPRLQNQTHVVVAMTRMKHTLGDLGYQVSTGPLVWNRHKPQFSDHRHENNFPVVWAEAITVDGRFVLKAEKTNHQPYIKLRAKDGWLITNQPCILLQRTTAKEQDKRLVAAALPKKLCKRGVVIENHLNMILPKQEQPLISPEVLALLLNSKVVNRAFKCISGSVAVSAYELESMPLPPVKKIAYLQILLDRGSDPAQIEEACNNLYQTK